MNSSYVLGIKNHHIYSFEVGDELNDTCPNEAVNRKAPM